jgi:hypothetical protein
MPKFDILCKNCDTVLGYQEGDVERDLDVYCEDCQPNFVNPVRFDASSMNDSQRRAAYISGKATAVAAAIAAYQVKHGHAPNSVRT